MSENRMTACECLDHLTTITMCLAKIGTFWAGVEDAGLDDDALVDLERVGWWLAYVGKQAKQLGLIVQSQVGELGQIIQIQAKELSLRANADHQT